MRAAGWAPRPHDLLWLADAAVEAAVTIEGFGPLRCWPAPAVVRRAAPVDPGLVPVGWRGATRSERVAGHVRIDQVTRTATPEAVARDAASNVVALRGSALACLRALARVAPLLDALPIAWGVTGGVGFALASGLDVLRPDSDLDLLLRAPSPDDATVLRDAAIALRRGAADGTRIDVQVETPLGAFALAEWRRTGGAVLLKTPFGPRLAPDPWRA